jgi:hypothetical protein
MFARRMDKVLEGTSEAAGTPRNVRRALRLDFWSS